LSKSQLEDKKCGLGPGLKIHGLGLRLGLNALTLWSSVTYKKRVRATSFRYLYCIFTETLKLCLSEHIYGSLRFE